jgi:hypothetical protein
LVSGGGVTPFIIATPMVSRYCPQWVEKTEPPTGHHAANLGDMADADCESQELTVDEERPEEGVLGAVEPAAIRIVVNDHVALFEGLERDLLGAALDEDVHAADHSITHRIDITD